jgi:hypothetical protein
MMDAFIDEEYAPFENGYRFTAAISIQNPLVMVLCEEKENEETVGVCLELIYR